MKRLLPSALKPSAQGGAWVGEVSRNIMMPEKRHSYPSYPRRRTPSPGNLREESGATGNEDMKLSSERPITSARAPSKTRETWHKARVQPAREAKRLRWRSGRVQ